MRPVPALAALLLLGAVALAPRATGAQVLPPHKPGTICVTPKLWCWFPATGTRGQPCSCPTPYGHVAGKLD